MQGQGPADIAGCGEVHSHPQSLQGERPCLAVQKPSSVPFSLEQNFPRQGQLLGKAPSAPTAQFEGQFAAIPLFRGLQLLSTAQSLPKK